jgi:hypothetical protein
MGIPRLAGHLQAYFQPEALGCKSCKRMKPSVVIDGPGLLYWIYYRILSKARAANPFEAQPSYHEVGRTTICYLDGLEEHGVIMYAGDKKE